MTTEFILGTAQLVNDYGITSSRGRSSKDSAIELLTAARSFGISSLDSSDNYGNSLDVIGEFNILGDPFDVISKWRLGGSPNQLMDQVKDMASRAKVQSLLALLSHEPSDLLSDRFLPSLEVLQEARSMGLVKKLGFSVYSHAELLRLLDNFSDIDILQIPANLLDSELLRSPELLELRKSGTLVHVRSIFLQGLLLAPVSYAGALDDQAGFQDVRRKIAELAASYEITPEQLAIESVSQAGLCDAVIIGVEGVDQLRKAVEPSNSDRLAVDDILSEFAHYGRGLKTDPRLWGLKS